MIVDALERRMEDVEVKIAFVEKAISDLDEVVRELAMGLDGLKAELHTLREQVVSEADAQASPTDMEPPPHY